MNFSIVWYQTQVFHYSGLLFEIAYVVASNELNYEIALIFKNVDYLCKNSAKVLLKLKSLSFLSCLRKIGKILKKTTVHEGLQCGGKQKSFGLPFLDFEI